MFVLSEDVLALTFLSGLFLQIPTGAFFAGAIVVFDKTWTGKKFDYIHRDELEQIGKAFIEQMKWLASRGVA